MFDLWRSLSQIGDSTGEVPQEDMGIQSQAEGLAVGVFPSGQEGCLQESLSLKKENSDYCMCVYTKQQIKVFILLAEDGVDDVGV